MRDLTLAFGQRAGATGAVNYVDVVASSRDGLPAFSRRLEFEHVGVDRLAEPEMLDGYVFGVLFLAMSRADRLVVQGPVSVKAMRNAQLLGEAWHCWLPDEYRPVEIVPDAVVDERAHLASEVNRARPGAAVAAFSGGADATFTALRHAGALLGAGAFPVQDLVMVHGFDVRLDREQAFRECLDRASPLIDELGASLHVVRTNLKDVSTQRWPHSFAAQLSCVLHQFSPNFHYGLIGSSEPYSHLVSAWGSHPATDYLLSGLDFEIVHDGAGFSRTDKIARIAHSTAARQGLRVCWQGEQRGRNCGVCEKCVRTRLNFLAVGVRQPECFEGPLALDLIRGIAINNRAQLLELHQIVDYAASHGVDDDWLDALRDRVAELEKASTC